jgi:hypothetical protein
MQVGRWQSMMLFSFGTGVLACHVDSGFSTATFQKEKIKVGPNMRFETRLSDRAVPNSASAKLQDCTSWTVTAGLCSEASLQINQRILSKLAAVSKPSPTLGGYICPHLKILWNF